MTKTLRIMIVEDNTLEMLGLISCVEEIGHQIVKSTNSSQEAIDFAKLVEEVVKPLYPVSYEALMAYD